MLKLFVGEANELRVGLHGEGLVGIRVVITYGLVILLDDHLAIDR